MKRSLILFLLILLAACDASNPTAPPITPAMSPSRVPSAAPSAAPSASPIVQPSSVPLAAVPTAEPASLPAQSTLDPAFMPALEKTIDLGPANLDDLHSERPMALDEQSGRLYISVSPTRTVVVDTENLAQIGEIPAGGTISVNPVAGRLYIGGQGQSSHKPDSTNVITPAELKLFDTTNLALMRSLIISATSVSPPLVEADPAANKAYIVQGGVYIADATTLDLQDTLTGTFPGDTGSSFSAVDAAVLPQQQRLFVSLNNGLDGSNNGDVLAVYDLATGQQIAQDLERSVSGFAVDETTGEVIAPRSHPVTAAIVKYDAQGHVIKRLEGSAGTPLIDPSRDRIYLCQWDDPLQLEVFDRDLNFLGVVHFPEIPMPQAILIDPKHGRVLVLQHDGKLAILKGQGEPLGSVASAQVPARKIVKSIIPSPNINTDRTLFALSVVDEYAGPQGTASRSGDAGATWQWVAGLPVDKVNDLQFADQLLFATAGGDGVDDGWGIWRSSDAGQTWQSSSRGLTDLGVTRLAVSPDFARDGTLYVLSPRGVFRSTDRGATWTSLADRYAPLLKDFTGSFSALALSPNFAHDNTLLIGHSSGLWRSTDRGETWTRIEGGPPATRLSYAPGGSIVFAINDDGVQRSTDGGLTWQIFNAGLDLMNSSPVDVQANDREAVVLMTGFGQPNAVYHLPLNGTMWQQLPIKANATALALTRDGNLLVATTNGRVTQYRLNESP